MDRAMALYFWPKSPKLLKTKELLNSSNDVMSNLIAKSFFELKPHLIFFQFSLFFVLIQTLVGTLE